MIPRRYRILRADRAAPTAECRAGQIVYDGADSFGCASDDTRLLGIEHVAVSASESGLPFFTIPRADIERVPE